MFHTLNRKQIRQQKRRARKALTRRQQRLASLNLCKNMSQTSAFINAKRVSVYLSSDGEIDLSPIIKLCWKQGKTLYLPVLHPIKHNTLWFSRFTPKTRLNKNKYKILEPSVKRTHIKPWALDLVIMPLVAFDEQCARMGMGGGYYDRTFAFSQKKKGMKGPKLIGTAHQIQQTSSLPLKAWDIPMHGVVTDQKRYKI